MAPTLSTTSYALLGLLTFTESASAESVSEPISGAGPGCSSESNSENHDEEGLTGYELKQRSDNTLRFCWTSPAMSQIYTELNRLDRRGLVESVAAKQGRRTSRRYRITTAGRDALSSWLRMSEPEFPILKHPVALRLMMGHLLGPDEVRSLLTGYVDQLHGRRAELQAVRDMLGDDPERRYPAMVAEWGLAYYDREEEVAAKLIARLDEE